ncbi:MAG: class I SAM-dependent methyltransferase [Candidatus Aenigmatarchaeota archaeon]|nr:class I SAM-dependent methyltransferase [Candidatus Aenigmarchaeota archaeon]
MKKDYKVLDLGAGYCYFVNNINVKEKHALDKSPIPLKYAKNDVIKHISDCRKLNFEKEYFDVVFCSNLLEHLTMNEVFLVSKKVNKILKKGGKFVILSPNYFYAYREYFDDYDHKSILTHKNIKDILVSCGFEIEKIIPRFLSFSANETKFFNKILFNLYLSSPYKPFAKQMLVIARRSH